jgi:hypothetical protein
MAASYFDNADLALDCEVDVWVGLRHDARNVLNGLEDLIKVDTIEQLERNASGQWFRLVSECSSRKERSKLPSQGSGAVLSPR